MRFRLHEGFETSADGGTEIAPPAGRFPFVRRTAGRKERIIATVDELEKLRWTIKRDLACGGGLLVLEFEEIPGTHSPQPKVVSCKWIQGVSRISSSFIPCSKTNTAGA